MMKNYIKKYNDVLNKVSNSIKKEFDSEPIYSKRFLKTKIKSYGDDDTDFQNKKIPKVGSNYTCLAVMLIDFVFKKKKKTIISKCF